MNRIRFIQAFSVDEHIPVDQFQTISRQADDALHEMLVIRVRVLENDNVAAFPLPVWKQYFMPGAGTAKNKPIHEQVVADQQRALHRCRRNLEGLYDETCAEE